MAPVYYTYTHTTTRTFDIDVRYKKYRQVYLRQIKIPWLLHHVYKYTLVAFASQVVMYTDNVHLYIGR